MLRNQRLSKAILYNFIGDDYVNVTPVSEQNAIILSLSNQYTSSQVEFIRDRFKEIIDEGKYQVPGDFISIEKDNNIRLRKAGIKDIVRDINGPRLTVPAVVEIAKKIAAKYPTRDDLGQAMHDEQQQQEYTMTRSNAIALEKQTYSKKVVENVTKRIIAELGSNGLLQGNPERIEQVRANVVQEELFPPLPSKSGQGVGPGQGGR